MRVLIWHVHGSWLTGFLCGDHTYLLPVNAARDADGLGRARTWDWPRSAREVSLDELRDDPPDVVVLQRPHEVELIRGTLGRELGKDLPAVYLEHNAPRGDPGVARHPMVDRPDLNVVHVTGYNDLMWDCGSTPTTVIEHGIPDPGLRYSGELPRAAVAINEPVRRGRITGTDLLPEFARTVPLDVFGMRTRNLPAMLRLTGRQMNVFDDPPQHELHREMARRRLYLHTARWTSLGLSLIEAMALGMPVVAVGSTEAAEAVPLSAGVVSTHRSVLHGALRALVHEPERAREIGLRARAAALNRYGLTRFLDDWDRLLKGIV